MSREKISIFANFLSDGCYLKFIFLDENLISELHKTTKINIKLKY